MIPKQNLGRAVRKSIKQPGYAVKNLNHRLKASLSYHLFNGRSFCPETISLFLTYTCNLKCLMCGQWGEKGVFKDYDRSLLSERLSLEEIRALIEDVRKGKPNITLFGGEPMMYPNWIEVVKMVKSAGLRCNIITNGTFIKRFASEIVDSGLDEIIFSLDGPREIHDYIRRVPGTFDKSMEGFRILAELKKKKKSRTPLVNINSTITEYNFQHIDEIIAIVEGIQASGLTLHHLLFLDKDTVNSFILEFKERFHQSPSDWIGFISDEPPKIDPEVLIQKANELRHKKYKTDVNFYPNLTAEEIRTWYTQFPFVSNSYKNRCLSLWATAYVFPDGSVRPYHTMNFAPGSIREHKFSEIWNNETYRNYRLYIKKHKCFSVCSKGCTEFFRY
ncbi:MAG: hypothetical protein COT43_06335 [Candidatus Marinimicrobia bacterium CG08_land_8_20_14_0_20_45_22]|nr:MAG: hypothetical protein COT43_06335 [Candidatus Marinimicrobia bacterium CG08_land_8_20_14_0_20_45_22]